MALNAKHLRAAIVWLLTVNFSTEVFAADPNHRLNEFACLKQEYRVCRNLNDMRSILKEITKLDSAYIDELLTMEINGFVDGVEDFSTFNCQVNLGFTARTLLNGLSDIEPDICAARNISEFVLAHSWKNPASSLTTLDYASTVPNSLQILNEIYLGDWAAIRSTEGNRMAQCFQSVGLLKNVLSHASELGVVKRYQYRIGDIEIFRLDRQTLTAMDIAQAAASGEQRNTYSKALVESASTFMPELDSKEASNPLLQYNESDVLCPAQTIE